MNKRTNSLDDSDDVEPVKKSRKKSSSSTSVPLFSMLDLYCHNAVVTDTEDIYDQELMISEEEEEEKEGVSMDSLRHQSSDLYSCSMCNKKYSSKKALQRHLRLVHDIKREIVSKNEPIFECPICCRTYRAKFYLRKHITASHADFDVNEVCPLKKEQKYYSQELKTESCPVCPKAFPTVFALRRHINRIHGAEHDPLKKSSKSINLPPKLCKVCNKSFRHACNLRRHIATHHTDVRVEDVYPFKIKRGTRRVKVQRTPKQLDVMDPHVDVSESTGGEVTTLNVTGVIVPRRKRRKLPKGGEGGGEVGGDHKQIVCTICDKVFNFKFNLRKHIRAMHSSADVDLMCSVRPMESKIVCPGKSCQIC